MSSLDDVVMTKDQYDHIFASKWHYRWWAIKFYLTHPRCIWRDLWWQLMPAEIVRFNNTGNWDRRDFERWCWDNVGFRYISWDIKVNHSNKDENYDFVIKVRRGKTKLLSLLALLAT